MSVVVEPLRVIADDLTGACDVAAALLPWPEPVWVALSADARLPPGLVVRDTASRTQPPPTAAAAVRAALADTPRGWRGILLKKVDTGLRGALGAELDAAMDTIHAEEAFVLAAIPEMARTTRGGVQHADGVPVHRTAFAADPHNAVRDGSIPRVIERTSVRRAGVVELAAVRDGAAADAIDRLRAEGRSIVVWDAETDADLQQAMTVLCARPRPLVLVGSTGLARAVRAMLVSGDQPTVAAAIAPRAAGVLVVAGSLHPVARAQIAAAEADGAELRLLGPDDTATASGDEIARRLAGGRTVVLATSPVPGDGAAGLARLAAAVRAAIDRAVPRRLVLVGGETARCVLDACGVSGLAIDGAPWPLAVCGRVAGGPFAGMVVVTKGGSTGPEDRLVRLIREAA